MKLQLIFCPIVTCLTICHGRYVQSKIFNSTEDKDSSQSYNWPTTQKAKELLHTGSVFPERNSEFRRTFDYNEPKFVPATGSEYVSRIPNTSTLDHASTSNYKKYLRNYDHNGQSSDHQDFKPLEKSTEGAAVVPVDGIFPVYNHINYKHNAPLSNSELNYFVRGEPLTHQSYQQSSHFNPKNYFAHQSYSSRSNNAANKFEYVGYPTAFNFNTIDYHNNLDRSRGFFHRVVGQPNEQVKSGNNFIHSFINYTTQSKSIPMSQENNLLDKQYINGYYNNIDESSHQPDTTIVAGRTVRPSTLLNYTSAQTSKLGYQHNGDVNTRKNSSISSIRPESMTSLSGTGKDLGLNNGSNNFRSINHLENKRLSIGSHIINSILEKVHKPYENMANNIHQQYAKSIVLQNKPIDDGGLHVGYGNPPARAEIEQVRLSELPEGNNAHEQYAKSFVYKNKTIDAGGLHAGYGNPPATTEIEQVRLSEPPEGNERSNNAHGQNAKSFVYKNKTIDDGGLHVGHGIPPVRSEIEQVHLSELPEGGTKEYGGSRYYNRKISSHLGESLEQDVSTNRSYIFSDPQHNIIRNVHVTDTDMNQDESFSIKELLHGQTGLQEVGRRQFQGARKSQNINSFQRRSSNPPEEGILNKYDGLPRQGLTGVKNYAVLSAGKQGSVQFLSPTSPGEPALRVITLGNRGKYVLPEGIKIQPGEIIPGTMGLKVPAGFRAHVIFGSKVKDSIRNAHKSMLERKDTRNRIGIIHAQLN